MCGQTVLLPSLSVPQSELSHVKVLCVTSDGLGGVYVLNDGLNSCWTWLLLKQIISQSFSYYIDLRFDVGHNYWLFNVFLTSLHKRIIKLIKIWLHHIIHTYTKWSFVSLSNATTVSWFFFYKRHLGEANNSTHWEMCTYNGHAGVSCYVCF